ncbi:NADPH oxidase organizer 1 isoform X2 [Xenopus tropicalis]|uniref:NADPH oxidase organizer 1 n=1 Tax=Xenopus tropicalis TaxID=8364 RepID=A0A6I8PSU8_XENTR|nr:NADPH oxidase organizer 1 isoform X2 [Xenopus tropicalis]
MGAGNERFELVNVRLDAIPGMKVEHNMFSILWSDHNEILIYRTFEDFKKLNRQLKKKFPLEAGLFRKSDNLLPKLKDVPIFRKNRTTNRFIERLRLLEKYSQELLRTDGKISQCDLVLKFFTPSNNDLNPKFPENSLVMMTSDSKDQKEQKKPLPEAPAIHPIVSQQYICMEDYETKDTKNRPLKVKRHELVGVLIKENTGWWLVENEEKHLAWFPAPYLKDVDNSEDTDSGTSEDEGVLYYAAKAYEAMNSDEVSITVGVLVEVIEKSNNGWWLIRYNGKAGYVPSMYLKPYRTYQQLQMISQGKFTSTPNLFKAASNLSLNRVTVGRRPQQSPDMGSNGDQASRTPLMLDRRKSRSLYGLPSNIQRALPSLASGLGNGQKGLGGGSNQTLSTDWKDKPKQNTTELDFGGQEQPNSPTTMPEPPAISYKPHTPLMPQRPKHHEILHRCTTVTKNALQKTSELIDNSVPAPQIS